MSRASESANERILFHIERQNEAYHDSPSGTWAQRWLPFVCKHERVRCTHGDEIIHRRWRRRACMVCGRSLRGPIPSMCFFTGRSHPVAAASPTEPPTPPREA